MTVDVTPRGARGAKAPPSGALGRAMMRVARFVHRRTGNKMSGVPLLYLTTVGAKSGQRRTAAVMSFPEGDHAWLIVASRGGTADHPSWFYNLAEHPDRVEIEIQGRKTTAAPQTLTGDERAAAWERITREQPRYAGYQEKTDREIPVVRLTAR
jgi:deazaflavin-dependent oxidoreductase (nitroreductase family)